jgi:hypothetical protein
MKSSDQLPVDRRLTNNGMQVGRFARHPARDSASTRASINAAAT